MQSVEFNRSQIQKATAAAAIPAILLVAAAIAHGRLGGLAVDLGPMLDFAPHALAAVGALVAWRFHDSRMVILMGLIALGHTLLGGPWIGDPIGDPVGGLVFCAFAILVPVNVLVLSLRPERGLLTVGGGLRLALVAAQMAAVAAIAVAAPAGVDPAAVHGLQHQVWNVLRVSFLPEAVDGWTVLPHLALVAFPAAVAVLLGRGLWTGKAMDAGAAGALAAVAAALHGVAQGPAPGLWFTAAGLIGLSGLWQESYRLAFVDDLTGLPGRRALNAELAKLGRLYAIAMLDVDHFKAFNDTHGHDIGDQVLRMVAARMMRVKAGGRPFRYGGEEFCVLFPGKAAGDVLLALEDLRRDIERSSFVLRAADRPKQAPKEDDPRPPGRMTTRVSVTASLGVADHAAAASSGAVLIAADQALYTAKRSGRNQVMPHESVEIGVSYRL